MVEKHSRFFRLKIQQLTTKNVFLCFRYRSKTMMKKCFISDDLWYHKKITWNESKQKKNQTILEVLFWILFVTRSKNLMPVVVTSSFFPFFLFIKMFFKLSTASVRVSWWFKIASAPDKKKTGIYSSRVLLIKKKGRKVVLLSKMPTKVVIFSLLGSKKIHICQNTFSFWIRSISVKCLWEVRIKAATKRSIFPHKNKKKTAHHPCKPIQ